MKILINVVPAKPPKLHPGYDLAKKLHSPNIARV